MGYITACREADHKREGSIPCKKRSALPEQTHASGRPPVPCGMPAIPCWVRGRRGWRAMRCCGVPEEYITGDASDYDKFCAWCQSMPKLIGNPLYHWSHLELKRYFDCDLIINEKNCDEIWRICNEKLADPSMSVRNIIKNSGVKLLCTPDDPSDTLEWHKLLAEDDSFDDAGLGDDF